MRDVKRQEALRSQTMFRGNISAKRSESENEDENEDESKSESEKNIPGGIQSYGNS